MRIKWRWLRDIMGIVIAGWYLVWAGEADEKLRKFRATCTVDIMRATWEKTSNPYLNFFTSLSVPRIPLKKRISIPRPTGSAYRNPIICYLYYDGTEMDLIDCKDLILDIPGGGFIAQTPEHHELRTVRWAVRTGRPVLGIDYRKSPEYPYPYAIDECYDLYKMLVNSKGKIVGMGMDECNILISGDSAGGNIATSLLFKLIETKDDFLPLPVALALAYPALDLNLTSWMRPSDLSLLRSESVANLKSLASAKDHLSHRSPLSAIDDVVKYKSKKEGNKNKWRMSVEKGLERLAAIGRTGSSDTSTGGEKSQKVRDELKQLSSVTVGVEEVEREEWERRDHREELPLRDRVRYRSRSNLRLSSSSKGKEEEWEIGHSLTMSSRSSFFNDRIISPTMMRMMALCYVGPDADPGISSDYRISPVFAPIELFENFPPTFIVCGERDPLSDDTLILSGKIHAAKRAKQSKVMEKLKRRHEAHGSLKMTGISKEEEEEDHLENEILEEQEDDWSTVRIYEGWSHGFLQMLTLLPEVEPTIHSLADFIISAFEKHAHKEQMRQRRRNTEDFSVPTSSSEEEVLTFTARKRPAAAAAKKSPGPSVQVTNSSLSIGTEDEEKSQSLTGGSAGSKLSESSSGSGASARSRLENEKKCHRYSGSFSGVGGNRSPSFNSQGIQLPATAKSPVPPVKVVAGDGATAEGFLDPKDMLKRRREEALVGINDLLPSSSSSTPRRSSTPTLSKPNITNTSEGKPSSRRVSELPALLKSHTILKRRRDEGAKSVKVGAGDAMAEEEDGDVFEDDRKVEGEAGTEAEPMEEEEED